MNNELFRHLRISAFYGSCFGLIAGHVDIVIRIVHQFFEWFELYQALAVPTLIGASVFALLGVIRFLKDRLKRSLFNEAGEHRFYLAAVFFLFAFAVTQTVINYIVFPDLSFWDMERIESSFLATFGLLTALILILKLRPGFLDRLRSISARLKAGLLFSHYLRFAAVFCTVCLAIDIFEMKNIPTLGPNPERDRAGPNIIVITLDTVRADYLTPYDPVMKTTPFLDEISRQSVLFEKAISTSSWTLPAHASIFTGKWVFRHGAYERYQLLDPQHAALASLLKKRGYRTAAFVGGPYCKAKHGFGPGFDTFKDRLDFIEYRHTSNRYSLQRLVEFFSPNLRWFLFRADGEKTAPEINGEISRWLQKNGEDPFFLFINYFDAHEPYNLGGEFQHEFTAEKRRYQEVDRVLKNYYYYADLRYSVSPIDRELTDYISALYKSELRFLDRQLSELFRELQERKLLDNTVVIISSDHGEEFMEHNGFTHKQTLFMESVHVPLIVYAPSRYQPRRVDTPVSNMDIFATTLEIAGARDVETFDSISLVPLMTGAAADGMRPYILSELYSPVQFGDIRQFSWYRDIWHLIDINPPQERIPDSLFNTDDDPLESRNLFGAGSLIWKMMASELYSVLEPIRGAAE